MSNQQHHFLFSAVPLALGDAVAAIILVDAEGYLMQRRDDRADIWYPGHWGLFGGAVEINEEPLAALRRELSEELDLAVGDRSRPFAQFDFDLDPVGLKRYYRKFYTVTISTQERRGLVLREGAEMRVFSGPDALRERISPYDSFALFLHYAQGRLAR